MPNAQITDNNKDDHPQEKILGLSQGRFERGGLLIGGSMDRWQRNEALCKSSPQEREKVGRPRFDQVEFEDGLCIRCGNPINGAESDVCMECQDGGDPREDR